MFKIIRNNFLGILTEIGCAAVFMLIGFALCIFAGFVIGR